MKTVSLFKIRQTGEPKYMAGKMLNHNFIHWSIRYAFVVVTLGSLYWNIEKHKASGIFQECFEDLYNHLYTKFTIINIIFHRPVKKFATNISGQSINQSMSQSINQSMYLNQNSIWFKINAPNVQYFRTM